MGKLDELASRCIRCGFCIESCPTFLITGDESQSPRGRIKLAQKAHNKNQWDYATINAIDTCVGCRNCETVCPSGVEYGHLLELAREEITELKPNKARKSLIDLTTNPKSSKALFGLATLLPQPQSPGFLSIQISGQTPTANIPKPQERYHYPPLKNTPSPQADLYLFEGCLMDTLFPNVNEATKRLLQRLGFSVHCISGVCCGALHDHAGYANEAERKASQSSQKMQEKWPIIVNSAGCGSKMKESKEVGTRTFDISEFLHLNGLADLLKNSPGLPNLKVTYHDACHLSHGQKIRKEPRDLIASIPGIEIIDLPESELCCGSAGTYNQFQPDMARQLLDRKWKNVESTQAQIVVSGNPGCHAWLEQASQETGNQIIVLHTAELLEASFIGELPIA